jgi:uncharacterized protein (DUF1810 family)
MPTHDLDRFVEAQNPVWDTVRSELVAGHKRTHWMWFIFPQLQGLGRSSMAHRYGISGVQEASAYLEHPVLGPRLLECTRWVNEVQGRSVAQIFGSPDDLKFHSSMTLFGRVNPGHEPFLTALSKYFSGQEDRLTIELLG